MLNRKMDDDDGVPTDGLAGIQTRRSLQSRRSIEHRRSSSSIAFLGGGGDREGLMHSYDVETGAFGLTDLTEESDNESNASHKMNGGTERQHVMPKRDDS